MGDAGAVSHTLENDRARPGYRPLGGGGALTAVLQGGAVLALRRAEVGGDHHPRPLSETTVQGHGCQNQPLAEGGAGPVQAEEGNFLLPGRVRGADALVEQVAGKQPVQLLGGEGALLKGQGQGLLLHSPFGLLPGGLPKGVVLVDIVKAGGQRALPLHASHHIGGAEDGGRRGQRRRLPPDLFCAHGRTSSQTDRTSMARSAKNMPPGQNFCGKKTKRMV